MFKVGICDDQLDSAKCLGAILESKFIQKDFNASINIITDKQSDIYNLIKNKEIDILFLDIDFKDSGQNGVEFAKELRKINKNFYLIFVSSHEYYVRVLFNCKTFDFLMKPITKERVDFVVDRLISEFKTTNSLYVKVNRNLSINVSSIIYIEKIINACYIHTLEGKYSATITLDSILQKLPDNFIKSHKSYIINKDMISVIDRKNNYIIFVNNLKCPMSSHFKLEEESTC